MAAFTRVFERFVAFRRIPMRVVVITGLASYVLQLGAILQGQPLYIIALFTLIPWIPLVLFEGLWKYEHYSFIAVFAIITALQVGHLGEHAFQVGALYGANGVIQCPFPRDLGEPVDRAVTAGLRPAGETGSGIYASSIVHANNDGTPQVKSDGSYNAGPPACGVFGQLDFETIHFFWDTAVWIGALLLLWRFPRNIWLWISVIAASFHEMEHTFLFWIYVTDTAHIYRYVHNLYATTVSGNTVTAIPLGKVAEPYTFYEAGGKQGLLGQHGMVETLLFNNKITFPFRPVLHFGYNSLVVIPTVIGFFWQSRKVYDAYLAKAIPTLSEAQLIAATPKLERLKFEPGQVIIRQGDPADRFYIITRGGVDVVRQGPDGQEQVVNRLSQGQYFGEIGLLHGGKRIATCRAVDEVELLALDRETFSGLMSESDISKQELDRIVRQRVLQTRAVQGGD
jgi:hypothetical protein